MNLARGIPSLAALLGLVAVAGYQNRDRIGDFIKGFDNPSHPGGGISNRMKGLGDNPMAISINEGLVELVERFTQNGQGETADSWVVKGLNKQISEIQLEEALGTDLVDGLITQTGLSRVDLLSRLAKILPEAVDQLTPQGLIPTTRRSQDPVYGDATEA